MWNTCLWSWMNRFTKQKLTLQSSIMTVKNILGKCSLVSLDWAVHVMQCDKNSKVVFCHTTPLLVRKQLVTRKPTQFWKQLSCHTTENVVKGILNKKMKILSSLTHLHDLRKIILLRLCVHIWGHYILVNFSETIHATVLMSGCPVQSTFRAFQRY